MADIVNLRTERKRATRRAEERSAAANRLAYGRSKESRVREQAQADKRRRELDAHRIETGDER
jgi:uncharacterized protein DUF4169